MSFTFLQHEECVSAHTRTAAAHTYAIQTPESTRKIAKALRSGIFLRNHKNSMKHVTGTSNSFESCAKTSGTPAVQRERDEEKTRLIKANVIYHERNIHRDD